MRAKIGGESVSVPLPASSVFAGDSLRRIWSRERTKDTEGRHDLPRGFYRRKRSEQRAEDAEKRRAGDGKGSGRRKLEESEGGRDCRRKPERQTRSNGDAEL
jgi:hypothetical protein